MELHKYQIIILQKLMYKSNLRFRDLQVEGLTSEHFTYHLKKLVEKNLIKKVNKGYKLTNEGKDFVGKLDTETLNVEKNPKVSVLVYICRKNKKGISEYLMSKRLKQPYYGKVGNITGKVRFNETFKEAAKRELKEETGLNAKLSINHVYHKVRFDKDEVAVQNSVFVVFRADNPNGGIKQTKEAKLFWTTLKDLYKRRDLFDDVEENFKVFLKKKFCVVENVQKQKGF